MTMPDSPKPDRDEVMPVDQCPNCGSRNTTSHALYCRNPHCRWHCCSQCSVTYDPVSGKSAVTHRPK
jgi:hypothetical protein